VRDEQGRELELTQEPAELAADRGPCLRVERRKGLVEQKHGGVVRERARQRDPLPLAAGQLARPCAGEVALVHVRVSGLAFAHA